MCVHFEIPIKHPEHEGSSTTVKTTVLFTFCPNGQSIIRRVSWELVETAEAIHINNACVSDRTLDAMTVLLLITKW